MAGLWETWTDPNGSLIYSCTILTTAANDFIRHVHHRMPVILAMPLHLQWLDPNLQDTEQLLAILNQSPAEKLQIYPVGRRVNSPRNDDAKCLEPLPASAGASA